MKSSVDDDILFLELQALLYFSSETARLCYNSV